MPGGKNLNTHNHLIQKVDGELLVYDTQNDEIHLLSKESAHILEEFEENESDEQRVEKFRQAFPEHSSSAEEIVEASVGGLSDLGLVKSHRHVSTSQDSVSRREVLKIAGVALITTVLAPTPAAAQSGNQLVLVSAVYGQSTGCPGVLTGTNQADSAAVLSCLQSLQGPTSVTFTTGHGPCGEDTGLGVPDPAPFQAKVLLINYTCGGVAQPPSNTCNFQNTITCPS